MERERVLRTVFQKKPELKRVLDTYGLLSIDQYVSSILNPISNKDTERKRQLLTALENLVTKRLGKVHGKNARKALEDQYVVSTADHHGPLCHPFFSHMFLAQGIIKLKSKNPNIVILPCASISLSNSSFPRGLFFNDNSLSEQRLHLISDKHDRKLMLTAPSYTRGSLQRIETRINSFDIAAETKEKLSSLIRTIYGSDAALAFPSFNEQVTYTNHLLAKELPGFKNVNLYYIPHEELMNKLLIEHIRSEPFWQQLFFDADVRRSFLNIFDGITGAHHLSDTSRGTYMFWGVTRSGERLQLALGEQGLVSKNGELYVAFTPQDLSEMLDQNRLIPNGAIAFMVSLYHELVCGGGFSQINYLGGIKTGFLKLLEELGDSREQERISSVPTTVFLGEIIGLTLHKEGRTRAATLLDCILYPEKLLIPNLGNSTLKEGVLRMMPEYYKIITGQYPANKHSWLTHEVKIASTK